MRPGLNAWVFDGASPLHACLERACEAGYQGVELNLGKTGRCALDMPDASIRAIGLLARDIGIHLPSLCTALYWEYSLTSPDPDRRYQAMEILKRQIHVARLLGADRILCVPGAVGVEMPFEEMFDEWKDVSFDTRNEVVDYATVYDMACQVLSAASKTAEDEGVVICVENVGNKFLLSPLEMARFLDEIASPYVRAYFDIGNVYRIGYPEHWIRALGTRIEMVHCKDYSRAENAFVRLGDGDTDFRAVLCALEDVGYDGWLTVEYMGAGRYDRQQLIVDTASYLKDIIGGRRQ